MSAAPSWAATDTFLPQECYNASHGPRIKLWALGVTPTVATTFPTPAANQPPPPPLASPNHPPPFPMPAARTPRTVCPTCSRQGNALCMTNRCKADCRAHSTLPCKVHETLQPPTARAPAQPSVPRPPTKARPHRSLDVLVAGLEDARAVLNTPQRLADLAQNHLAQQQEQAARLAALTPLPPSPTRSQEDRDRNMAIRLALGNSPPPPHLFAPDASHYTLALAEQWPRAGKRRGRVSASTTSFHFLCRARTPAPDPYYDHWNFSLGVWVAIPLAYEFTVLTDEPILIRRSGTFAADQAEMVAAFSHLVKRVISPAPRLRPPQTFSIPERPAAVRKVIKLEPRMPTAYRRLPPAVAPPFASLGASTSRLPALSPSPVASSSRLRLSSPSFDSRFASSSPFPSPPSLLYSTCSSTASSSSLASPGSSSAFPISFVDKD
ncbi:hypothetical protein B0H14DRAFT_3517909 [Mycena olivaceomarginata]|nr:hypothetical protein B0H14DRAFT_3517909 [Mycena olivaceomarginata]